jgi:hypothetical protein
MRLATETAAPPKEGPVLFGPDGEKIGRKEVRRVGFSPEMEHRGYSPLNRAA